jgi:hypothetical protein
MAFLEINYLKVALLTIEAHMLLQLQQAMQRTLKIKEKFWPIR